jgi:mono/diheme cytochrome c family protein
MRFGDALTFARCLFRHSGEGRNPVSISRARHSTFFCVVSFGRMFGLDSGLRRNDGIGVPAFLLLLCLISLLTGCERAMHDMYSQPKYKPGSPSPLFANHNAARRPPDGSIPIAAGELAGPSSGRLGHIEPAPASSNGTNPYPITFALLQRGRDRYDIYCAACHGYTGEGNGMIVQRGFPRPLSYLDAKLMHASDADLERSIRGGYGAMYPFGNRIDVHDRWAIVAYIRALQLSQHAPVERLAPQDLKALEGAKSP